MSDAVPLGGDGLSGIRVGELATGTQIRGNVLALNEYGIHSSAQDMVIAQNLIQTNTVGIIMANGVNALITGNGVQNNNVGIGVLAVNATISGNVVTGNRNLGITIHGGTGNAVAGNSLLGNGVGLLIQTAAEATAHGNNIFGNNASGGATPNAGVISNSTAALDVSSNYWGAPTVAPFPGDLIYNLGTGSLQNLPIAAARLNIALQPMK